MKAGTESSSAGPMESPKSRKVVMIGALALAGVVGVIIYGYMVRPGWVGVSDKKFWDYLELLIVPTALAIGVAWLNWAQRKREREAEEAQQEREAEEAQQERERVAEEARRERELEVESQRAQDEALQASLGEISQLLTDKDRPLHRARLGDSLSTVARARTLTVLTRLDATRKRSVLQFLYEAGLIQKARTVVDLSQADLSGADLIGANLHAAYLNGADLIGANLPGSNLSSAKGVTNAELESQATSLEGATMPNGQKYEEWLKGKGGHREDGGK